MLYLRLSGSDRDAKILNALLKEIERDSPINAIKMGLHNSRTFHVLGNNYLRILNGIWVVVVTSGKERSKLSEHERAYVIAHSYINDIGWGLSQICITQYKQIYSYIVKNKDVLSSTDITKDFKTLSNLNDIRGLAINLIQNGITLLDECDKNDFHNLRSQAFRHLYFLSQIPAEATGNKKKLVEEIKKIKSKHDRVVMQLGLEFVEIEQLLNPNSSLDELNNYYAKLKKIKRKYEKFDDMERVGKCFCLLSQILIAQKNKGNSIRDSDVIKMLEDGIKHNEENIRYDEMLKCYLELAKYFKAINENDKAKCKAMEGYKYSIVSRNYTLEDEFSKIFLPRKIILFRHGEAEKNINAIINGSSSLTENGKKDTAKALGYIKKYLESRGYDISKVHVYGDANAKSQVKETLDIFRDAGFDNIHNNVQNLRPTYMGILAGVSEINLPDNLKIAFNHLQRWRNNTITLADFNVQHMEMPEHFWARAKQFIESIKENECSIVVCTSSIAILLTHCFTMDELDKNDYKHIHVPLCGMINLGINEDGKYIIINKDSNMNILFSSLQGNSLTNDYIC